MEFIGVGQSRRRRDCPTYRTLAGEPKGAGNHEVIWDGKDDTGKEVASGIYFYRLKVGEFTKCKKMVLLK